MTGRKHQTIGEVLKALRDEFPETSISKIRFLESEGLVEPERTPSGYRKFYPPDVARLRYILRLQRDNFMPLKVIRKRLEQFELSGSPDPAQDGENPSQPQLLAAQSEAGGDEIAIGGREEDELPVLDGGLNLSPEEFVNSSGLSLDQISELEEFALIDSHNLESGEVYYDEEDLQIARIAKDFGKFGIGARHLKMYKNFAEKELGLFDQVLFPLTRGSGADGRGGAGQSLSELAKLSRRLKHALLGKSLRDRLQG